LAVAPNQAWSWDISKRKAEAQWTCFHLSMILDIFSRHGVGWLWADRECADLAEQLIADAGDLNRRRRCRRDRETARW
jgi:putative transposase